ncbi:MAG: TetR/AcrR family transcriptional regulator [Chloroflexota bacterium]|nr:TetR/AcrR family transcriptional regulator [Chloroflexota bacterium]
MARIIKEHQERRQELLDVAQELFYRKGYDSTSITDVIEAVGIAKGTFYHYFKSKEDLLDQIIERQTQGMDQTISPIVQDTDMNATQKFNMLHSEIAHYKAVNRDVMLLLTRVLYADANLLFMEKMMKHRILTVAPKLAEIISQGVEESVFDVEFTYYTAELILRMWASLGKDFGQIVLYEELNNYTKERYIQKCRVYENAAERMLGAEEGSLHMFDREALEVFFEG